MKPWDALLAFLDHELGSSFVDKWIRTLKILKFDARNLYLDVTNPFQIHYFKQYVSPLLPKYFLNGSGKPIKVHFTIHKKPLTQIRKPSEKETTYFVPNFLEPHATLENFVIGNKENFAYKIFAELMDPSLKKKSYNPIYLYGPKGSGKSHLLMATAHNSVKQGKKCFFVRSETFTEHVIRAFRSAQLQEFRKIYRNLDLLIIDDVHLFSRKMATQEELFHTFNYLYTEGKQIVLSAQESPRNLKEIEERLISRFEWGLSLPVTPPSLEITMEIVEQRSKSLSLVLNPPLKQFLITHFTNLHSLIRALEALILRSSPKAHSIDFEIAQVLLQDLLDEEEQNTLTPEKMLQFVANTFDVTIEDILGDRKKKEFSFPRQIAMYLFRQHLQMSFLKIGHFFMRNHSTVMTSIKKIERGVAKRKHDFLLPLSEIRKKILHY